MFNRRRRRGMMMGVGGVALGAMAANAIMNKRKPVQTQPAQPVQQAQQYHHHSNQPVAHHPPPQQHYYQEPHQPHSYHSHPPYDPNPYHAQPPYDPRYAHIHHNPNSRPPTPHPYAGNYTHQPDYFHGAYSHNHASHANSAPPPKPKRPTAERHPSLHQHYQNIHEEKQQYRKTHGLPPPVPPKCDRVKHWNVMDRVHEDVTAPPTYHA